MIKQRWMFYTMLTLIVDQTLQLPMSCSYGQRGSLTSTCYNANSVYFKRTTYRFDNLDETVRCVNCSLEVIESGTFDITRNQIKYLDLENSQITVLKEKSFIGLVFMRKLNLKNNHIVGVPVNTFQGATKIEELNMETNRITALVSNGFKELTNLKKLNLKNNHIKNIENGSFNGLVALEELNLDNNNIESIQNIFPGLQNIRLISLNGNKLAKFNPLDIMQTDQLLDLNLAENLIKILEKDSFLQLPRLENLNLSFNPISVIEMGGFRGLDSLEQLDLSHCAIKEIPKGILASLHQLRTLDLAFNSLSVFQTGVFSGLPELRRLNMSYNSIKDYVKTGLFSLHSLHSLDLSFNNLTDLDYKMLVNHLPALSFLSLKNNSLPCFLKKEIDTIFEHDNLVLDLGEDVVDLECNDSRTLVPEEPAEEEFLAPSAASAQVYTPSNSNDYVLYFLVTLSLGLIAILFYVQYRNRTVLVHGNSTISQTRLINNSLEDGDTY